MCLTVSAIIVVLTILATVIAGSEHHGTNGTIIVPLTARRMLWLRPDNSVNFDVLDSHIRSIDAKMLRGFENYERNTGRVHPLAMESGALPDLEKRETAPGISAMYGAVGLTNLNDVTWYGSISIGTPPRSFTVDIDTGSSDLFLPGPECSSCDADHPRWNPALSDSARYKGLNFMLGFDDGDIVEGDQYTDNVTIAGLTADLQTIGVATQYATNMKHPPVGLLGLAFPSLSKYPASPLFQTLINEGKVAEQMFAVKMDSDGGELYLGGTNTNLFKGEIPFIPVTTIGYWQVEIDKIRVKRNTILKSIPAIIDTGANLIVGDRSRVSQLHRSLGGRSLGRGYYCFPCKKFPTIAIYFGNRAFRIFTAILNQGEISTGSPECFSGIVGRGGVTYWTLGAVFIRNFYTVFDVANKQVGFADLAPVPIDSGEGVSKG